MSVNKKILAALLAVIFFMSTGTIGYMLIEGYTVLEALYMTVITLTTVGYGEINPLSDLGRVFTIFLIMLGVGGLAFGLGSVTEAIFERATDPKRKVHTMEKKIAKLKGHTIICGFGRVGSLVANQLKKAGESFVVIENQEDHLRELEELNYHYLAGDATRETIIHTAGVKTAASFLALLDSDPENLFAVLTARELNPTLHIISRSQNPNSQKRILRAGADSTISPFESAGNQIAKQILGDRFDFVENHVSCSTKPQWIKVDNQPDLIGKSVEEVQQATKTAIIGVRISDEDHLMPEKKLLIPQGAKILTLDRRIGGNSSASSDIKKRIVFIDDNPVICTLYTRLFQKAGFFVFVAKNGKDGIETVKQHSPDAVVVDYHLPDTDGLEVTRSIRKEMAAKHLKIFLFTADEEMSNMNNAYDAGVDTIVLKSPDANELVTQVNNSLNA